MLALWQQSRGPYGEIAHLPEGGGLLDQHAPTMLALRELSAAWHWLEEKFPAKKQHATGSR